MSSLVIRPLLPEDRPRVLDICSQIWDGEDYVPEIVDQWIEDREGEAVGAVLDGRLIAFAHRTWLHQGIAWFEGIRTDPAHRGRGAGKAITEHFIEGARRDGAQRICLSTYIDNEASIHIIERYGFRRVASFALLEKDIEASLEAAAGDPRIEPVSASEALAFIDRSDFLRLAQRRFPRGWRFFPFDVDPQAETARLRTRWGLRVDGQLQALVCIRQPVDGKGPFTLGFLDGDRDGVRVLLREVHRRYAGRHALAMVPKTETDEPVLLDVLRESGYATWDDFAAAVFVYERTL